MTQDKAGASIEKDTIILHRAYRKLAPVTKRLLAFEFSVLALPFILFIITFYSSLTLLIARSAQSVLSLAIAPGHLRLESSGYHMGPLYYLAVTDSFPSFRFSASALIISLAIIVLVWTLKQTGKPIGSWLTFIALINAVSALFFIFFPDTFPYTAAMYSQLYLKTMLAVWLLIPIVLSISLSAIPSSFMEKFLLISVSFAYSILLGAVRYAFFMSVLYKYSLFFMPMMVFALGPLLDFIYVVAFYSVYMSNVSVKLRERDGVWRWLF
jgi:hypothetical protein